MRPIDENEYLSAEHICKERHPYAVAISELDYQRLLTFFVFFTVSKIKKILYYLPLNQIGYSVIKWTVLVQLLHVSSRFIYFGCLFAYLLVFLPVQAGGPTVGNTIPRHVEAELNTKHSWVFPLHLQEQRFLVVAVSLSLEF